MEDEELQRANAHLDAMKPAQQRYDQEIARIDAIHDQAVAPMLKKYDQIKDTAWKAYNQAKEQATNQAEHKAAFEQYDQIVKTAWQSYLRETDKARSEQLRSNAQAREVVERETDAITETFFGTGRE